MRARPPRVRSEHHAGYRFGGELGLSFNEPGKQDAGESMKCPKWERTNMTPRAIPGSATCERASDIRDIRLRIRKSR